MKYIIWFKGKKWTYTDPSFKYATQGRGWSCTEQKVCAPPLLLFYWYSSWGRWFWLPLDFKALHLAFSRTQGSHICTMTIMEALRTLKLYSFNLLYLLPFISFCTILPTLSLMHKACLYFLLCCKKDVPTESLPFLPCKLCEDIICSTSRKAYLLMKIFKHFNDFFFK